MIRHDPRTLRLALPGALRRAAVVLVLACTAVGGGQGVPAGPASALPAVVPATAPIGAPASVAAPSTGRAASPAASASASATAAPVAVAPPAPPAKPPQGAWVPKTWLPGHLLVVYYGNPFSSHMGILGEGSPSWVLGRLRAQAADYKPLTILPVQPALDLIATVAQGSPQPHGTYRLRMPASLISKWAGIADKNHMPLFLDVQVGRSTVPAEVRALEPFLRLPWVELALDPEFDMPPGEVPGKRIGTMSATDVNWALKYLSGLVHTYHLPQKILIVHQWTSGMLPNWQAVAPAPHVALILDMDGFGGQQTKQAFYGLFVRNEPIPGRFGGIKLFYTQDHPLFTPGQVMGFDPTPSMVMYQ